MEISHEHFNPYLYFNIVYMISIQVNKTQLGSTGTVSTRAKSRENSSSTQILFVLSGHSRSC